MRAFYPAFLLALALAEPAAAQLSHLLNGTIDVDKSRYTLFNPTPRQYIRPMVPNRPGITESPYLVDVGQFQYEPMCCGYSRGARGRRTATTGT